MLGKCSICSGRESESDSRPLFTPAGGSGNDCLPPVCRAPGCAPGRGDHGRRDEDPTLSPTSTLWRVMLEKWLFERGGTSRTRILEESIRNLLIQRSGVGAQQSVSASPPDDTEVA